jgi:uncharacterized YccA/Bax inhibitor family protein
MLNEKTFTGENVQAIQVPGRPDVRTDVMTVRGVVSRTFALLVLTVVSATFGWQWGQDLGGGILAVLTIGLLGLVVLSFVTVRRPKLAIVLGPLYAVIMGFWAGIISRYYEAEYEGIVLQAVFATLSVFCACLVLYVTRIVKVTDRFRFIVGVATLGILLMYVVALVLGLFGVNLTFIDSPSPLGILLSVAICIVAALNLFVDFRFFEDGAAKQAPLYMAWYSAFGLLATLIWLYLEMLRLLSKIRQ